MQRCIKPPSPLPTHSLEPSDVVVSPYTHPKHYVTYVMLLLMMMTTAALPMLCFDHLVPSKWRGGQGRWRSKRVQHVWIPHKRQLGGPTRLPNMGRPPRPPRRTTTNHRQHPRRPPCRRLCRDALLVLHGAPHAHRSCGGNGSQEGGHGRRGDDDDACGAHCTGLRQCNVKRQREWEVDGDVGQAGGGGPGVGCAAAASSWCCDARPVHSKSASNVCVAYMGRWVAGEWVVCS